jgi:hypothetical protein
VACGCRTNRGDSWQSLQRNLPPVPVHDMMLRDDDLAIATHGRAFWVMENLTPLRWAPEQKANAPYLYKPVPVYRLNGQAQPTFTYTLPADSMTVRFEFFDARRVRCWPRWRAVIRCPRRPPVAASDVVVRPRRRVRPIARA